MSSVRGMMIITLSFSKSATFISQWQSFSLHLMIGKMKESILSFSWMRLTFQEQKINNLFFSNRKQIPKYIKWKANLSLAPEKCNIHYFYLFSEQFNLNHVMTTEKLIINLSRSQTLNWVIQAEDLAHSQPWNGTTWWQFLWKKAGGSASIPDTFLIMWTDDATSIDY